MRTPGRSPRAALSIFGITQFLLEVQFWFPLWLIFLLQVGIDMTTAVLADGVFRIVSVAAEIPMGVLADRWGRRRTYLATAALSVVTFAGIAAVSGVAHLFIVWAVWGVLWALNSGAATAYAYELSQRLGPTHARRGFAVVKGIVQVAVLVSLATAGLVYAVDPRLPFALTAALAALAFALALLLPDTPRPTPAPTLRSTAAALRDLLNRAPVRATLLCAATFFCYGWSLRILFQPLALDLHLPPSLTGLMYSAVAAVGIVGALATGWAKVRHRWTIVGLALLGTALVCGATALRPGWGPVLWLPVLSLTWTVGWTLLEFELADTVQASLRATLLSIVSCLGGVGIAVARPTLGVVADRFSSAHAFGVWAAVGVAAMGVWLLGRYRARAVAAAAPVSPPPP